MTYRLLLRCPTWAGSNTNTLRLKIGRLETGVDVRLPEPRWDSEHQSPAGTRYL